MDVLEAPVMSNVILLQTVLDEVCTENFSFNAHYSQYQRNLPGSFAYGRL